MSKNRPHGAIDGRSDGVEEGGHRVSEGGMGLFEGGVSDRVENGVGDARCSRVTPAEGRDVSVVMEVYHCLGCSI